MYLFPIVTQTCYGLFKRIRTTLVRGWEPARGNPAEAFEKILRAVIRARSLGIVVLPSLDISVFVNSSGTAWDTGKDCTVDPLGALLISVNRPPGMQAESYLSTLLDTSWGVTRNTKGDDVMAGVGALQRGMRGQKAWPGDDPSWRLTGEMVTKACDALQYVTLTYVY